MKEYFLLVESWIHQDERKRKCCIRTYVNQTAKCVLCVWVTACVPNLLGSSSVWSGPVKGPNEDIWGPRGGPDAEVDNGLVKISVVQCGCFLWGKTDQIYLLSSVPWPPRDHLKHEDLSLMCKYLQKEFSEEKWMCHQESTTTEQRKETLWMFDPQQSCWGSFWIF